MCPVEPGGMSEDAAHNNSLVLVSHTAVVLVNKQIKETKFTGVGDRYCICEQLSFKRSHQVMSQQSVLVRSDDYV